MEKNKTGSPGFPAGRYLRYSIGEIVLVVLGILIALQINNWNQGRIETKKEKVSLNNLLLDLEEQSELLDVYIEDESDFYQTGLSLLEHYAQNNSFLISDTILSQLNTLAFRRTFSPINTTFTELVSTGNIGLIKNEKLKRNIIKCYSALDRDSKVTFANNTNLVDGLYNPVLFEQTLFILKINFSGQLARLFDGFTAQQNEILNSESLIDLFKTSEKILNNPEKALNLFNVLQIRILLTSGQITRYNLLQEDITELINDINLYLN